MSESNSSTVAGLIVTGQTARTTEPEPGMVRQVLAHSAALMLVRHDLRKGWRGAAHSHPHEQLIYIVNGAIEITVNGASHVARTGDSLIVESNATHQATALEDSLVLDIFTPKRDDYV